MTTPYSIRINNKDEILKIHKTMPSLKTVGNVPSNELVLELSNIDLSHLVDLTNLSKGQIVKGIWTAVSDHFVHRDLTNLMVDYLQETKSKKDVSYWLEDYKISFDEWHDKCEKDAKDVIFKKGIEKLKLAEKKSLTLSNLKAMDAHSLGACFSLPAIAGTMANGIYYTVQVPYSQVPTLFKFLEEVVPVQLRSQRTLDLKRARAFCDYILSRRHDYVVPALTAAVSKSMKFNAVEGFNNQRHF